MNKFNPETQKRAKELRIIDDALFRLIAARPKVCEEILRTLLEDDRLEVISVTPQETMVSLFRGITLDALCRLGNGTLCNIEMQKGNSNDDIKRVRFHASLITANYTLKGTKFEDIPSVKVLYITEYDALNNGQSVTHVSRCQKVKNDYFPVDDGEDIIFANTVVKTGDKQSQLLQLFLKQESFDVADYPNLSAAIQHYKDTEKGRDEMCEIIEEYANEVANERAIEAAIVSSIETCIMIGLPKQEVIEVVGKKFPQLSSEQLSERVDELWEK